MSSATYGPEDKDMDLIVYKQALERVRKYLSNLMDMPDNLMLDGAGQEDLLLGDVRALLTIVEEKATADREQAIETARQGHVGIIKELAVRRGHAEIIKALAAVARLPDTDAAQESIEREPVMVEVCRIRNSADAILRSILCQ